MRNQREGGQGWVFINEAGFGDRQDLDTRTWKMQYTLRKRGGRHARKLWGSQTGGKRTVIGNGEPVGSVGDWQNIKLDTSSATTKLVLNSATSPVASFEISLVALKPLLLSRTCRPTVSLSTPIFFWAARSRASILFPLYLNAVLWYLYHILQHEWNHRHDICPRMDSSAIAIVLLLSPLLGQHKALDGVRDRLWPLGTGFGFPTGPSFEPPRRCSNPCSQPAIT